MADLHALRELYAFMRETGTVYARAGELELRLGPEPIAPSAVIVPPAEVPEDEDSERRDLETLLFSSGADATPFLRGRSA